MLKRGGVCYTHGATRKQCSFEGCTNRAVKAGVCITHGAKKKRCSHEGCNNQVYKGGVCRRHSSKNLNATNNNHVTPVIASRRSVDYDYEEEEGLNSWIWKSTRRDALNYASGTSSLPQPDPAPVVSAPSVYDHETDNDDAFSTQGR